MPAKNGKTGSALKAKYAVHVGKMTGPKTKAAMAKVLSIGMTEAKQLAPMEYGTLMNSAFRRINDTPMGIQGVAGFSAGMTKDGFNYALYLHEHLGWKPRPVSMKKGPSWNPDAEPKYLEKGFTSSGSLALMKKALGESYK